MQNYNVPTILIWLFAISQLLYLGCFLLEMYFRALRVNRVDMDAPMPAEAGMPFIVLLYPVLRELERTMETTFTALAKLDYPRDRYRVVAIPNADDTETIASLRRLTGMYPPGHPSIVQKLSEIDDEVQKHLSRVPQLQLDIIPVSYTHLRAHET